MCFWKQKWNRSIFQETETFRETETLHRETEMGTETKTFFKRFHSSGIENGNVLYLTWLLLLIVVVGAEFGLGSVGKIKPLKFGIQIELK